MVYAPLALDDVRMVNVADVLPAATRTYDGAAREAVLLLRSTSVPPAGAGPVRVIVPVTVLLAITVEADNVRLLSVTAPGWMVNAADRGLMGEP